MSLYQNMRKIGTMDKIDEVLTRGIVEILPSREEFKKLLTSGKKIRIYLGADPTAPQLHLGHSTNFLILKKLQDLGHKIIILIGDFTGMIGDPTGKDATRIPLTRKQVLKNAATYKDQISKIISFSGPNAAEIRFNSEWLDKLSAGDLIKLMSNLTVQQMIERDMFQKRLKEAKSVALQEFTYPLLQGYDSVMLDVDAEMGGTDQTFNMLVGRELMKKLKGKQKFVITTELLVNPKTGKKLMSKSEGNYVGLNDLPNDMYAKIMAFPDEVIEPCFRLCTNLDLTKIDFSSNPMELKKKLAHEIVKMYHSEEKAKIAQSNFERTFQERKPTFDIKVSSGETLANTIIPFTSRQSMSNAKELIKQGSVDINGKTATNPSLKINIGDEIKVGGRTFLKATK